MSNSGQAAVRSGRQSAAAAEQTKREILDAALACFANQGFTATSLRDVAERAGITHGLPRHHFGSKEQLWKACAAAVVDRIAQQQSAQLEEIAPETALESFQTVTRVFIRSAARYPDFWRLLAFEALKGSERLDYVLELTWPQHARIAELFDVVQAQGHLQGFDNNSFFLSLICLGAMPFALSPMTSLFSGGDILAEDACSRHEDLVMRILFGEQLAPD